MRREAADDPDFPWVMSPRALSLGARGHLPGQWLIIEGRTQKECARVFAALGAPITNPSKARSLSNSKPAFNCGVTA
jgi:hypothetical protein